MRISDWSSDVCSSDLNNTSIILVSHNPYQVQRLCDKVLMLDQGKKIRIDNAFKALELYFEFSPASCNKVISSGELELPPADTRNGSGQLRITGIEQIGPAGAVVAAFQTGASATLRLNYKTLKTVADRSEEHTSE